MRRLEARLSTGSNDASSFKTEVTSGESAWYAVAARWKLMVAGGMGKTSERIPPRRTGTTTATRPLAAMCLAFQLSGATARPAARELARPLDTERSRS